MIQSADTPSSEASNQAPDRRRVATVAEFEYLANSIPQLAWMADASGHIYWFNRRWYDFTGMTFEEMHESGWSKVHHPDHAERVGRRYDLCLSTGEPWEDTFPLRGKDGEFRWFLSRAEPVRNEAGEIVRWFGTNTDITHRKLAEQDLQAARDAAEKANRAKSQFIANMSHELRTPLSAVIGYSEMLAEEIEDLGHTHLLSDVAKIESSARHLLSLINDVLDLSKIEAGRMTVASERFSVKEMLDDVVSATGSLIEKKDNRFTLDVSDDLGEMRSDELKLRQCLLNLIGNSAKFTENGTITLRVRREEKDRPHLLFEVVDTGIGMSEEQVGRLFQRFSQADESTTRQFGGTGLGLALTRAFARKLGGDVEVESREGEGSTFRIRVPAEIAPDAGEAPVPQAKPGLAPERSAVENRVLVVDDDPSARDLLTRFLQREGFSVTTAADGEAGLSLVRTLRPQAVLLDVEMPRMDGWAVLHAIRSDPELSGTPVIMISVVNEQSLGYALGATDYLVKPIEWDRLKRTMEPFHPLKDGGSVMLIDDDADARERLRFMLSREGWTVVEAGNGREALDRLAADGAPGLILLDLMMPVMDGFDFLQTLRQRPDGGIVPVVVLTAKDVTPEERARLDQQADRIISKGSMRLSELAEQLRSLMPKDLNSIAGVG